METLNNIVSAVDSFVWGPVMIVLLIGTGIFLTVKLRFRTWRNLGYALHSVLSKEARTTKRGSGDVSPFACLCTALAATIGMVLPSFCIIFAISRFLDHFLEITWIAHAFQGIKIAVGILILDAAVKMLQKMQKKPMPLTFMLCAGCCCKDASEDAEETDASDVHALCFCSHVSD